MPLRKHWFTTTHGLVEPGKKLGLMMRGTSLWLSVWAKVVVFVEADADVTIEQFVGESLQPQFPCVDQLVYDYPNNIEMVVDYPMLTMQVTRLQCGGFILAITSSHVLTDGTGVVQFLTAVAELTRGLPIPTTLPVWDRHLLTARNPPQITHTHPEYDDDHNIQHNPNSPLNSIPTHQMVFKSLFFGPNELTSLRRHITNNHNHNLQSYSNFDLLTACLWRCRTAALQYDNPSEQVRVTLAVNARQKFNPPLPRGYYGNACAFPAAISSAGELTRKPLSYAVGLVKEAKESVTEECMRSLVDFVGVNGRPSLTVRCSCRMFAGLGLTVLILVVGGCRFMPDRVIMAGVRNTVRLILLGSGIMTRTRVWAWMGGSCLFVFRVKLWKDLLKRLMVC